MGPLVLTMMMLGLGLADGPTPFPEVQEAQEERLVELDEAIYAYLRGVTWVTQDAEGRLTWHDCTEPGRIEAQLDAAPRQVKDIAVAWAEVSGQIMHVLTPVKHEFATLVNKTQYTPEALNAVWWVFAWHRAGRVEIMMALQDEVREARCTTGRCDCVPCEPNEVCDCKTSDRAWTCNPPRRFCSTSELKTVIPTDVYGY